MRRSHRILILALVMALIASFAVPMAASAGGGGDFSSDDEFSDDASTDEFSDDASTDEYPRRGVQTGGGSTATGGTSPLPLILSGGAFTLLMATGGGIALRRRLGR